MAQTRPSSSHQADKVRAVDVAVGDDGDAPGYALDLTQDDIDDIAFDRGLPLAERVFRLSMIADELQQRRTADMMGDVDALLQQVRDRLATLKAEPGADTGFAAEPPDGGFWEADEEDSEMSQEESDL